MDIFENKIVKIAQRQETLPPDFFHDTFSMHSSLFKTAGAKYCLNKLRHREMSAFGSS